MDQRRSQFLVSLVKTCSPLLVFSYRVLTQIAKAMGKNFHGAQMVILSDHSVLLVRTSYRAQWEFPGGAIDAGEDAMESAIREAHEEAGIIVHSARLLDSAYHPHDLPPQEEVAVYLAEEWEDTTAWVSTIEILERRFFPLRELPKDLAPASLRILHSLIQEDRESP